MRDGLGLAGAEKVESTTNFGLGGGEAGGSEEGGIDLACFSGGEEGAWSRGSEFTQEREIAGWGGGSGNEEWRDGRARLSHFPGKVG